MTRSMALRSRQSNNSRRRYHLDPTWRTRQGEDQRHQAARLEEVVTESDGNCLFRAVSDQVYHTPDHHRLIRLRCMDYIRAERDFFQQYLTENLDAYCDRKEQDGEWGDDIEIQALGEIYQTKIEIYSYNGVMLRTFHEDQEHDNHVQRASAVRNYNDGEECIEYSEDGNSSNSSEEDDDHVTRWWNSSYAMSSTSGSSHRGLGSQRGQHSFRIRLMYRGSNHYNSLRVRRVRRLTQHALLRLVEGLSPAIKERREPGELEEMALQRIVRRRDDGLTAPARAEAADNQDNERRMSAETQTLLDRSRQEFEAQKDRELDDILKLSIQEEEMRAEKEVLKRSLEENWKMNNAASSSSQKSIPKQVQEQKYINSSDPTEEEELLRAAIALSLEGGPNKCPAPNAEEAGVHQKSGEMAFLENFAEQAEYSESVLMCVSMGFPVERCVKAQEFVGDDTDAMLAFLTSNF